MVGAASVGMFFSGWDRKTVQGRAEWTKEHRDPGLKPV